VGVKKKCAGARETEDLFWPKRYLSHHAEVYINCSTSSAYFPRGHFTNWRVDGLTSSRHDLRSWHEQGIKTKTIIVLLQMPCLFITYVFIRDWPHYINIIFVCQILVGWSSFTSIQARHKSHILKYWTQSFHNYICNGAISCISGHTRTQLKHEIYDIFKKYLGTSIVMLLV